MTDIVSRLRQGAGHEPSVVVDAEIVMDEAADEIERLRSIVSIFETNEAERGRKPTPDEYCFRECIAPQLRAALEQSTREDAK